MKSNIQEIAMDFMSKNDCNFFTNGIELCVKIYYHEVEVESIWYSDKEDKIYLHVGCPEFEGDIDIDSLSDWNQKRIACALKSHI